MKTVRYRSKTGNEPFTIWLEALSDKKAKAQILNRLNRVTGGNFGVVEQVGEGVAELKIDFGPGYRIYFGQWQRETVVLLSGGDKSTQQRDIAKAKKLWADWKSRQAKG